MSVKQGDNIDFQGTATCKNIPLPVDDYDAVPKIYVGYFAGALNFNGELTPPQLTASVNNYDPTGLRTCNFLRLSANGNYNITGLERPPTGNQGIFIVNVGGNNITISDNSASSSANNRFLIGGSKTLQTDEGMMIIYDQTSLRWRSQSVNI